MAPRHATAPARRPRRSEPKLSYADRVNSIAAGHERRMNEVLSLRREDAAPETFADRAHALLTQRWSKANWRARERILRAVDWLLHMERLHQKVSARADFPSSTVAERLR